VGEEVEVGGIDLEQARDVVEGECSNLGDGQESVPVVPLVLPLRVDDPWVRLDLARPREPEATPFSVSSMGLSAVDNPAYGNRLEVLPQPGIGTVKVNVMVDAGGFKRVQEGYLLPEDFPEPATMPMAIPTNMLPAQSAVNASISSSGNVNIPPPVGILSRS
jgi:hypothetical protein